MYRIALYGPLLRASGKLAGSLWENEYFRLFIIILLLIVCVFILKVFVNLYNRLKITTQTIIHEKTKQIKQKKQKIMQIIKNKETSSRQLDKLSKLFCLKNAGALSDKEFEIQKEKILSGHRNVKEISDKQIRKLTILLNLKNAGGLTKNEFEEQKAKILKKIK